MSATPSAATGLRIIFCALPHRLRRSPRVLSVPPAGPTDAAYRLRKSAQDRLRELLDGWRPAEHRDLEHLITLLSREVLIDASTLHVARGETDRSPA
jgi:hypothetical protein